MPVEGINRTISALFAEDPTTHEVFLLHRGKVGGGRSGIGKNAFTAWYNGGVATVDEMDGRTTEAFLLTSLHDPHMPDNVADFVNAVSDFKSGVVSTKKGTRQGPSQSGAGDFHDEFSGKKNIRARASTTADCNHGRVVTALKRHLEARLMHPGDKLVNTKQIDLALARGSEILHVWEIKTDVSLQSLYTGIGQLIVHTMGRRKCSKTLVMPDSPPLPNPFIQGLSSLGISVIQYNLGQKIRIS